MRFIDSATWYRRQHFTFFKNMDDPHFSLCAPVDVTALRRVVTQRGVSFNVAVVYALARTANGIDEFRTRIRGEQVVEHDVVHPSSTVMAKGGLFGFCHFPYDPAFSTFDTNAQKRIKAAQQAPQLYDDPSRDDLLFMTAIPWVSFTSFTHPVHLSPADSVPRMAWGKFFEQGDRLKMPVSVRGHHALMDGAHAGRYFEALQALLDQPQGWLTP